MFINEVKTYILGHYCVHETDLQILNKQSNLDILDVLLDAYPSALTANEISNKTGIPIKTVYAQTDELFKAYIINEIDNRSTYA